MPTSEKINESNTENLKELEAESISRTISSNPKKVRTKWRE